MSIIGLSRELCRVCVCVSTGRMCERGGDLRGDGYLGPCLLFDPL